MDLYLLNEGSVDCFADLYDKSVFAASDSDMIIIGAVENGKAAGLIAASVILDEVEIKWLYVAGPMRRKKVASALLAELRNAAEKFGVEDMYMFFTQAQNDVEAFVKSQGFSVCGNFGWACYEASLGDLKLIEEGVHGSSHLSPFLRVSPEMIEELNNRLAASDLIIGVPLPIDPRDYSPFSCCAIADGKIESLILVQTGMEGSTPLISIPWVYVENHGAHGAVAMYNTSIAALKESFGPDSKLFFSSFNPAMDPLIAKVLPGIDPQEIYLAAIEF